MHSCSSPHSYSCFAPGFHRRRRHSHQTYVSSGHPAYVCGVDVEGSETLNVPDCRAVSSEDYGSCCDSERSLRSKIGPHLRHGEHEEKVSD